MSSAQIAINTDPKLGSSRESSDPPFELTHPEPPRPLLKQEIADRIAAHRARRGHTTAALQPPADTSAIRQTSPSRPSRVRSANIAAAVAERYAQSPSYRSFLAAEAERALHQADAAAQIATINAQAIAVAQQQLLADLDNWSSPGEQARIPVSIPTVPLSPVDYAAVFDRDFTASPAPVRETSFASTTIDYPVPSYTAAPSFTVRPYADAVHAPADRQYLDDRRSLAEIATQLHAPRPDREFDDFERMALEEEIDFRLNPIFDELSQQEPISANLIEFPRQLVATRKARPRIAEGPLRDDHSGAGTSSQLRIFEVEADQLSPTSEPDSVPTEWSSILLSALPSADFTETEGAAFLTTFVPQAAPVSSRLKAAVVDGSLILAAQAAFTAVFVLALTHLSGDSAALDIPGAVAAGGILASLVVFAIIYQLIFFTFSDATPGMRFARIAFCTFTDENPTRSAMRRRLFATLLAASPLGFGILWAFLDEDTLGWHDRISRMYQRAY